MKMWESMASVTLGCDDSQWLVEAGIKANGGSGAKVRGNIKVAAVNSPVRTAASPNRSSDKFRPFLNSNICWKDRASGIAI
jgi:hypothetical protein